MKETTVRVVFSGQQTVNILQASADLRHLTDLGRKGTFAYTSEALAATTETRFYRIKPHVWETASVTAQS